MRSLRLVEDLKIKIAEIANLKMNRFESRFRFCTFFLQKTNKNFIGMKIEIAEWIIDNGDSQLR